MRGVMGLEGLFPSGRPYLGGRKKLVERRPDDSNSSWPVSSPCLFYESPSSPTTLIVCSNLEQRHHLFTLLISGLYILPEFTHKVTPI